MAVRLSAMYFPQFAVFGAQTILLAGHIGFTFFSMGSIVAVEALAPRQRRASAQGLLVFVNSGLGALAGHWLTGSAYDHFELADGAHDWSGIFLIPALGCLLACVLLVILPRHGRAAHTVPRQL